MDIIRVLTEELQIKRSQTEAAVKLIDEGNTIPFIARYRKEATGSLNDEVLRNLDERLRYLRGLEERKEQVISSIREQGKLTPELEKAILEAPTLVRVEDLYLPYRPKRRTRAGIAKEKGLEPLAELIWQQDPGTDPQKEALRFVSEEKEVPDAAAALAGALDIIAERISDDAEIRSWIRRLSLLEGVVSSEAKEKEEEDSVYSMYYHFAEPLKQIAGHRVLALNRGEKEKALNVKIEFPEDAIRLVTERRVIRNGDTSCGELVRKAAEDALGRLILPAIERELRNELTEKAENGAIEVFGKNLTQLLMQPPIRGRVVLGWDPAFRTGCKLAVVDETGRVLDTAVIYPTAPQNRVEDAKKVLRRFIRNYHVSLISLGNGTASRESEQIIADFLREIPDPVKYVIVSEAGASVYSASALATEEFPEFDVGQRSAVSIARRLEDPLAELVKIDPKAIGVGQYQHDMNQKKLSAALEGVVETAVNRVGVDLNTASASLLEYVAGISKTIAKNIVAWREENGRFESRRDLLKVAKLGPKAYEQCAGFARIPDGKEPLDATGVHPESYGAARLLLQNLGCQPEDLKKGGIPGIQKRVRDYRKTAEELGIGEPTLRDICAELEKPGRDPRSEMPEPVLRTDVLEMKDLKPGMKLKGTVRNVVDFGAFVDIGVHQDGLVHISHMSDRFIKHPMEAVSVGDVVEVTVLSVDMKKKRIALSMKKGGEA